MEKVYGTKAITTGGRQGKSKLVDHGFEFELGLPKSFGGDSSKLNPEQLFAVAYSACFEGALSYTMNMDKTNLKVEKIECEVDLLKRDGGFTLAVVMTGFFEKGTDIEVAKKAMEVAHQFCPYSYATRGNISVELKVFC